MDRERREATPVDWATVSKWLKKNPHARSPPPMKDEPVEVCEDVGTVWRQIPVSPSTPLSCVLYALDVDSYSGMSVIGRKDQLRRTCTDLQARAGDELKGRAWPKAKTNDGIVEVAEKDVSPWGAVGLAALVELYGIQLVVLNETEKKIAFIPEDATAWDRERPVYYVAHNYRSVYVPPAGFGPSNILSWLREHEGDGWVFVPKEVKGTVEELRELAAARGLGVLEGKMKKDALVEHVSRGVVYAHFRSWSTPEG
jgi:hypothetical protein